MPSHSGGNGTKRMDPSVNIDRGLHLAGQEGSLNVRGSGGQGKESRKVEPKAK